jgi:hypothetical protein
MEKVMKCGIKKQKGYLYFIDKHGDISRAKMARGGKKNKKIYFFFFSRLAALLPSGADSETYNQINASPCLNPSICASLYIPDKHHSRF